MVRDQFIMTNQILELKLAEKTCELEKANLKLAKANEDLLELDKVKMEFLRIISHEIRTSLNGILGPIILIKDKLEDSKYSNLLEILISSASRLEKFSLTALAITELKTGIRNSIIKRINLNSLIQDVLISANKQSKQKNIIFDLSAISKELIIKGDLQLLLICLSGIIENAVKYSPHGGTIYIRTENKNNLIYCEISDEGPGFSDAAIGNLFKLFRPGEPHIDQNNGLGLTLAKLIMEAHSGNIDVENLTGTGAIVRLIFPKDSFNNRVCKSSREDQ